MAGLLLLLLTCQTVHVLHDKVYVVAEFLREADELLRKLRGKVQGASLLEVVKVLLRDLSVVHLLRGVAALGA